MSFEEHDVQGQIFKHILHQMEAIVFIILEIFFAILVVVKIGEYPWIFLSFCRGIFRHMTCLTNCT